MRDKNGNTIIRRRTFKEWWEDFKDQWRRYCSGNPRWGPGAGSGGGGFT